MYRSEFNNSNNLSQAFSLSGMAAYLNPWRCHGFCCHRPLACWWVIELND
jgi:hypothetical protein